MQKESPSVYCDWECFRIRNIAEGDRNEEKFITHGMGVQVSCGMGAKETVQDSLWELRKEIGEILRRLSEYMSIKEWK